MKNVPLEFVQSSKYWAIVTGGDGIPCVYEIGDYTLTEDRFLYLWADTNKDDYPLSIINMAFSGSVDFSKERPDTISIEEFLQNDE